MWVSAQPPVLLSHCIAFVIVEAMDRDSQIMAMHLLQTKLDDTRRALDEACNVVRTIDLSTSSPNLDRLESHQSDVVPDPGQGFPPAAVPAPSMFCLDLLEMIGSVRVQLIEQMSHPPESQLRFAYSNPETFLSLH